MATPPVADAAEIALALRLVQLSGDLTRAYSVHVRGRYGLSIARVGLLLLLDRHGGRPPRPADLAIQIGCSRATVTRLLQGMERSGLLACSPDREDGRARRVALTTKGARLARELRPMHARRLHALLWHTTADDRRDLERLIDRLHAGLRALRSP